MLTIYHSNKTDLLKDILVNLIQRDPLGPFESEQILVQSQGMAQWLKLKLAQQQGICAGVAFPLPAAFIWELFQQTLAHLPEHSPFDKADLCWRLMPLLQQLPDNQDNNVIQQYLADDHNGLKTYQLANQIADLFDHYLIYRPEWIYDWEQGGQLAANQHPWQPALLRSVMQQLERDDGQILHRADLFQQFFEQAEKGLHLSSLPKRIFVFGIASFPPVYLKLLQKLGEVIDVHIMLTNPCRYYWGDIIDPVNQMPDTDWLNGLLEKQRAELNQPDTLHTLVKPTPENASVFDASGELQTNNALLASMGKLGRDAIWLLSDLNANEIEAFVEPETNRLLHTIQRDILELNPRGDVLLAQGKHAIDAHDDSLRVVTCHSPMREIEILHDQLLDYFERYPHITPNDVVVMIPDIDCYAPFIQSVFGQQRSEQSIPHSISDRSALSSDPILQSVFTIVSLNISRFSLSAILSLIELPAIQQQFDLTESEIPQLRLWIDAAAIRWGLKHEDASNPVVPLNTWQDGIRRMLLGYAMGDAGIFGEILPLDEVEGLAAESVGKLAALLDVIEQLLADIAQPKTAQAWQAWINQLLEHMFSDALAFEPSLAQIRQAGERLAEIHSRLGDQQTFGFDIFSSYLAQQLENRVVSQRFAAGRVNFCTLMPMRSLPFKLVCLVGMNDGSYPRTVLKSGFDLIAEDPRKGDRSRRDDDRYMFIEAITAAEENLYISYIDRSIQDNSERFASVLVSELLEYIEQGFELSSGEPVLSQLMQQHPLTPFSPRYFNEERLFTYNNAWLSEHTHEHQLPALSEPELDSDIELQALLRFFRQPCEYFLTRRLGVNFHLDSQQTDDTEPFELNALAQYVLKDELLSTLLHQGDIPQLVARIKLSGLLPVGEFGELVVEQIHQQAHDIYTRAHPLLNEKHPPLEVNIAIGEHKLVGWLDDIYDTGLVRIKPGRLNGRDFIRYGLEHLCLQCYSSEQIPRESWLVDHHQTIKLMPLESAQARHLLRTFCDLFIEGMRTPLPLFPKTAWRWLAAFMEKDQASADKAAQEGYCTMTMAAGKAIPGEGSDLYIQRCFGAQWSDTLLEHTQTYATQLLQPLYELMEEGDAA